MPDTIAKLEETVPLSEIILRVRKMRGWSRVKLARKSEISTYTISRIENRRIEAGLHSIVCLLYALDLDLILTIRRIGEVSPQEMRTSDRAAAGE